MHSIYQSRMLKKCAEQRSENLKRIEKTALRGAL